MSLNVLSFVYDTTVYKSGPHVDTLIYKINQELKHLYDWSCGNKLSLNIFVIKLFSPLTNISYQNK